MVTASAPGKVHLIGEHAVVYGEPAIITAIGKRTYVEATKSEKCRYLDSRWDVDTVFTVEEAFSCLKEVENLWNSCAEKKNFTELFEFIKKDKWLNHRKSFIALALKHLGIKEGVTIKINSDVPVGSGLGSSSSLAVAATKAIAELFNKKLSLEQVNDIAFEMEKVIHGTPSGGDNSTCCFGGLIWFKKMQPKNEIKPLGKEVPHKLENFILVYTGIPEKTTGELVQMVRDLEEGYRDKHIKAIGKMVPDMLDAMKVKNYVKIREIINKTWDNLNALGLSTPNIDKIVEAVRKIGGAAKACGACGGGIVLCHHDNKQSLIETIKQTGFEPIEADLAVEGVRVEK